MGEIISIWWSGWNGLLTATNIDCVSKPEQLVRKILFIKNTHYGLMCLLNLSASLACSLAVRGERNAQMERYCGSNWCLCLYAVFVFVFHNCCIHALCAVGYMAQWLNHIFGYNIFVRFEWHMIKSCGDLRLYHVNFRRFSKPNWHLQWISMFTFATGHINFIVVINISNVQMEENLCVIASRTRFFAIFTLPSYWALACFRIS